MERRWAGFADGAPNEVDIRLDSDPVELANQVRNWLGAVVDVLETVDSTDSLVDLAIEGNGLQEMGKISSFLARTDDVERLRRYVRRASGAARTDVRWPRLAARITEAVGRHADVVADLGMPDHTRGRLTPAIATLTQPMPRFIAMP